MVMRALVTGLGGLLVLAACRTPLDTAPSPAQTAMLSALEPGTPILGDGAAPGNAKGPGDFVSRGAARNFYAGAGGRLWYYMNNYYWVPDNTPREDLWIKAVVVEEFKDLRKWPDGRSVKGPEPKVTIEYWEVAPSGRTVWLDNHKDYVELADHYTAGSIHVSVTLTLGHLQVRDKRGAWNDPDEPYVLEERNYRKDRGIGAARTRFKALQSEAVTVWRYHIPWNTHPQRLTRSNWKRLGLPKWDLSEKRRPAPPTDRVVTPRDGQPTSTEPK